MNDPAPPLLGVTVMPEYVQNETVDGVLDRLAAAGVNAVTTSPYCMEPADEKTGSREPPDDAGAGQVRLLDRPLWGRRELWVRTAPSFVPDRRLYDGLRYQPAEANDLTVRQGSLITQFLDAAKARGMKAYLQVQAAIPPGYRVQFGGPAEDDLPRLPDGRPAPRRLANNGSLASPHIVRYTQALLRDLCRAYPQVDGFRIDWPEYPPYFLHDCFFDFSEHAHSAAAELGFHFESMREAAARLWQKLHGGLNDDDLARWIAPDGGRHALVRFLVGEPGLLDWLRFKSALVEQLLRELRQTLTSAAGAAIELVPNAFPPPFTLASGFDFHRAAAHCSAASVKLYTMHWPMMLRFYGDALLAANPRLSESLLARTLATLFDLADGDPLPHLSDYTYPGPDEPHPVGLQAQTRKLAQAQQEAGPLPIYALVHGYGPADDFHRRLTAARSASPHGVWINRYGYLSDEKLRML